ncbi:hypothetical protein [Lonepinella sp. BR2357]|uniref:hypothetical protein n=1 Tax=Lonepinella sp. BR2357 TaxID=3434549 RepID=UPI003F6DE76E
MINYTPKHQIKIGGNMSKQGADKAGQDISFGIKFLFCCIGIATILGVLLWLLPDLLALFLK